MSIHLHFLRHAESEFNVDPESTTFDCALTHAGEQQAASLPAAHYSLVLMSPLKRARETLRLATTISYDELIIIESVREQKIDSCDFMAGEDSNQLESDEDLMTRADTFLTHIVNTYSNSHHTDILVVSHCEFIHACTAESPHNTQYVTLELRRNNAASSSSSSSYAVATSNTSRVAVTLYDDALHMILSYHADRKDFISSALTCKRWYASASSMRNRSLEYSSLKHFSCHDTTKLMNLIQSPLRHYITELSCGLTEKKDSIIQQYQVIPLNLATTMPHLTRLSITIHPEVVVSNKLDEVESLSLPSSITDLYVFMYSSSGDFKNHDQYESVDEADKVEEDNVNGKNENADGSVQMHRHIGFVMQLFARSVPLIRFLSCSFLSKEHYLPVESIEPFASHATLTHLEVTRPTQLCRDLICRMKQLKRIEGFELSDTTCSRARKDPLIRPVPQLVYHSISRLDVDKCAYFSRMTSLTTLRLDDSHLDPGELLRHLPNLTKLHYSTKLEKWMVSYTDPTRTVDAIAKFAPQLEDLFLRHEDLNAVHMAQLVPHMTQLRILRLCVCPLGTMSFLAQLSAPTLLEYLHLEGISLDTQAELDVVPTILPNLLNFACVSVGILEDDSDETYVDFVKVRSAPGQSMESSDEPSVELEWQE